MAIIGFVALIIIGMYGSVRVAQAVPGAFSKMAAAIVSITSIFVPANETITLSLPSYSLLTDSPATLAFDHKNKKVEGSYAFRYSCVDGVSFNVVGDGGTSNTVVCNTAFNFTPFNNSVTIVPASTATRFTDVEVFVTFTPSGAATPTVIGSTLVTLENQKLSTTPTPTTGTTGTTGTTPTTPAPKPTTPKPPRTTIVVPQGRASDPNGYVDLAPRVIEVGYLDSTGAFYASSTPSRNQRVAVRFAVENLGTKTSPAFTFSAVLPTFPPYTYFAPSQVQLGPGDRIEYTIGFDSFDQSNTGDFIVNVDPTGSLNDRTPGNNVLHYTITVSK